MDKEIRVQITQNENGEEIQRFECPECKEWSTVTKALKIRVVIFKCDKCEFVLNQSMDAYSDEEVN